MNWGETRLESSPREMTLFADLAGRSETCRSYNMCIVSIIASTTSRWKMSLYVHELHAAIVPHTESCSHRATTPIRLMKYVHNKIGACRPEPGFPPLDFGAGLRDVQGFAAGLLHTAEEHCKRDNSNASVIPVMYDESLGACFRRRQATQK